MKNSIGRVIELCLVFFTIIFLLTGMSYVMPTGLGYSNENIPSEVDDEESSKLLSTFATGSTELFFPATASGTNTYIKLPSTAHVKSAQLTIGGCADLTCAVEGSFMYVFVPLAVAGKIKFLTSKYS